jgi:ribose-phosphate pyrophosphokinase
MTLHSPQVHGFFNVPTDPLTARPLFVRHFAEKNLNPHESVVVSPDMGRANAAVRFATRLKLPVAAAEKRRISDRKVVISRSVLRQVEGYRHALIFDDEIATGTSVMELTDLLLEGGIEEIAVICTHGVFTCNALENLANIKQIKEIVTTNTVPIPKEERPPMLTILSVAPVFGEAIYRNYNRQSIGDLFTFSEDLPNP